MPDSGVFREVAAEVGLDFVHFNGAGGRFYFPETTASGGAFFDYDGDGDLDVFLVQGAALGGASPAEAIRPPAPGVELRDRLYRNDLEILPDGSRRLRFVDVTEASGIDGREYGMGVATGDYDNDGDVDLYVTAFGPNRLWRNRGDGTFEDATAAAGVDDPRWSVAALFFDYDGDGWLDLYAGNYVDFTVASHQLCRSETGAPDYCSPYSYQGETDRLWRNRGDGTFEDVSKISGVGSLAGPALGAIDGDFDGDGRMDLYVANDGAANFLWLGRPDGTFEERAVLSGCAVNAEGQAEASMGVAAADFDGDGDEDLFLAHLRRETHTLYLNDGEGFFDDASHRSGLAQLTREATGFGAVDLDYDGDGWLDLLVVNGAVRRLETPAGETDPYPFHQPDQLFHNLGGGRFEEATAEGGEVFRLSTVSRGAAAGDVDEDGDLDVLVVDAAGPVRLLRNDRLDPAAPWLGLRLVGGAPAARDLLGAWVGVFPSAGEPQWRRVRTSGSYASARDPRLLFRLAPDARVERVEVRWPDGSKERWGELPLGGYRTLRQGSGEAMP